MAKTGRPLEFDQEHALDAAVQLFWCRGYEATSMTDLLQTMNLSKSSLYHTFGSKQQLFLLCLARYAQWLRTSMGAELDKAESGIGFLEAVLDGVAATAETTQGLNGCLIVNSVNEFGRRELAIALSIDQGLAPMTALLVTAVRRAQAEGDISPEADVTSLTNYLHVAVSGLRTMIKAGTDAKTARDTVALILKGIRT
jgi:TetR/AcrR family transcriptional regulator, transcriptional repressor for nem operon